MPPSQNHRDGVLHSNITMPGSAFLGASFALQVNKIYFHKLILSGCVCKCFSNTLFVVMFLMSWITALITVAISVFLYLYVSYRGPDVNWGSSTQAQSYNNALKSVQDLNQVEEHVKNYRPQILIFSGIPSSRPSLIDFGYLLVKNVSLMLCAQVVKVGRK